MRLDRLFGHIQAMSDLFELQRKGDQGPPSIIQSVRQAVSPRPRTRVPVLRRALRHEWSLMSTRGDLPWGCRHASIRGAGPF